MNIISSLSIYKKEKYIIVPKIKLPHGGWQLSDRGLLIDGETSKSNLGEEVLMCINKYEEVSEQNKETPFWALLGYRTLKTFSKDYDLVSIQQLDDMYRIIRWKKNTSGYVPCTDSNDIINLPLSTSALEIGQSIERQFLKDNNSYNEYQNFKTIHNSQISYRIAKESELEDIGDGHTDAYQIFVDSHHKENYIAFMIDSGYESYSKEGMKYSLEKYHDTILDFDYQAISDKLYKVKVSVKTTSKEISSYLFEDGDDFLEVIYVIDLQAPETAIEAIRQEFEAVIQSIKIS